MRVAGIILVAVVLPFVVNADPLAAASGGEEIEEEVLEGSPIEILRGELGSIVFDASEEHFLLDVPSEPRVFADLEEYGNFLQDELNARLEYEDGDLAGWTLEATIIDQAVVIDPSHPEGFRVSDHPLGDFLGGDSGYVEIAGIAQCVNPIICGSLVSPWPPFFDGYTLVDQSRWAELLSMAERQIIVGTRFSPTPFARFVYCSLENGVLICKQTPSLPFALQHEGTLEYLGTNYPYGVPTETKALEIKTIFVDVKRSVGPIEWPHWSYGGVITKHSGEWDGQSYSDETCMGSFNTYCAP